jgi:hypothetical protein
MSLIFTPDLGAIRICTISLFLTLLYFACEPSVWKTGNVTCLTLRTPRAGILCSADGVVVYAADRAWELKSAITWGGR